MRSNLQADIDFDLPLDTGLDLKVDTHSDKRLERGMDLHSDVRLDRRLELIVLARNQLQMMALVASLDLDMDALMTIGWGDKVIDLNLEVVACPSPTTEK